MKTRKIKTIKATVQQAAREAVEKTFQEGFGKDC